MEGTVLGVVAEVGRKVGAKELVAGGVDGPVGALGDA